MKRMLLGLAAVALLAVAVAWSGQKTPRAEFDFKVEKRNPVTNLKLNNSPADFQFAIVSDRTGGHRARVFARAIEQLNLLQPEFVVSVGDLIEGYTESKVELDRQWREFQTYTSRLQMPFFYVAGNHDITNKVMAGLWKDKFGKSYYEFLYRDVLFVVLNSEDPPGKNSANISAEQRDWLKKVLEANAGARWTLVFLHKPMWILPGVAESGWPEVEKLLAGRKHTVFAGHVHRYQKFVRNGANYYMLATTGGDSKLRGVEYGEFDHLVWVTMKNEGPVLANVLLDGILKEDLAPIYSEEEGVTHYYRRPTYPIKVVVHRKGQPLMGATVTFHGQGKERGQPRADGLSEADGSVRLSTYAANDGLPAGDYAVTVELRRPFFLPDGTRGPNQLPAKYASAATTPLKVTMKQGANASVTLDLED